MNTVYLIGDSTVDDNIPPFRGWGWALPRYVNPGILVSNHALSGRSTRSFWEEGLFEPVRDLLSAGDLLLIQFGHNDERTMNGTLIRKLRTLKTSGGTVVWRWKKVHNRF